MTKPLKLAWKPPPFQADPLNYIERLLSRHLEKLGYDSKMITFGKVDQEEGLVQMALTYRKRHAEVDRDSMV